MTVSIDTILAEARDRFNFLIDYEDAQLHLLPGVLSGARRFVDVGANRGLYSYVANALLSGGEIIAVEANPDLSQQLEQNMMTWPNPNGNKLRVMHSAAGDKNTTLPFSIGVEDTLGTLTTDSDYLVEGAPTIEVAVRRLDDLVPPGPRTVLKIDVEGFEFRALRGAERHMKEPDCTIIIELHSWGDVEVGKYPHDVMSLLRQAGFGFERSGEAHQFVCRHCHPVNSWTSYLRNMPKFRAKNFLRRTGIRQLIYGKNRSSTDALRERSGIRQ